MNNKVTHIVLISLIILATGAGVFLYPSLPQEVASHWNASGQVDGYMQKFWGVFLFPILMFFLFILYFIIPTIDPFRENIESFRKEYNRLWTIIFIFLSYIFGLTLSWNTGYRFDFTILIVPAFAALWYSLGDILKKSKRNWFVGIRTPWTLSSETVWEKTHHLGAVLFKAGAFISLLALLIPDRSAGIMFVMVPVIAASIITVVYSYIIYKKELQ